MTMQRIELRGKEILFKQVDLKKESVWSYVDKIYALDGSILGYNVKENIGYYSPRYKKWVICEKGDKSDGATYAKDLDSFGWLFHDDLCVQCTFEKGQPCTNWQASHVLTDIMIIEGYWFRARTWHTGTFLFGGKKIKKTVGWW